MLESFDVGFPNTKVEVEIVLPISFLESLLTTCSCRIRFRQRETLNRQQDDYRKKASRKIFQRVHYCYSHNSIIHHVFVSLGN